jgi:Ca2+-dependent lipid-binding protein
VLTQCWNLFLISIDLYKTKWNKTLNSISCTLNVKVLNWGKNQAKKYLKKTLRITITTIMDCVFFFYVAFLSFFIWYFVHLTLSLIFIISNTILWFTKHQFGKTNLQWLLNEKQKIQSKKKMMDANKKNS